MGIPKREFSLSGRTWCPFYCPRLGAMLLGVGMDWWTCRHVLKSGPMSVVGTEDPLLSEIALGTCV